MYGTSGALKNHSVALYKSSVVQPHTPSPGNEGFGAMPKSSATMYKGFAALPEGFAALKIYIVCWHLFFRLIHIYVYVMYLKRLPKCVETRRAASLPSPCKRKKNRHTANHFASGFNARRVETRRAASLRRYRRVLRDPAETPKRR